jgi:hypothetical protein
VPSDSLTTVIDGLPLTTGFDDGQKIDMMDPVDIAGVPVRAVPASSEEYFTKDDFGPDDLPVVTDRHVFSVNMVSSFFVLFFFTFPPDSFSRFTSLQKEGGVDVLHISRGVPMRVDDHEDLVFCLRQFSVMPRKEDKLTKAAFEERFAAVKKKLDERFPGNTVTTERTMKMFIMDFLARALWPWRTIFVMTNPERKGGKMPLFNKIRFDALERKVLHLCRHLPPITNA